MTRPGETSSARYIRLPRRACLIFLIVTRPRVRSSYRVSPLAPLRRNIPLLIVFASHLALIFLDLVFAPPFSLPQDGRVFPGRDIASNYGGLILFRFFDSFSLLFITRCSDSSEHILQRVCAVFPSADQTRESISADVIGANRIEKSEKARSATVGKDLILDSYLSRSLDAAYATCVSPPRDFASTRARRAAPDVDDAT